MIIFATMNININIFLVLLVGVISFIFYNLYPNLLK